jgi:hypothetical protein
LQAFRHAQHGQIAARIAPGNGRRDGRAIGQRHTDILFALQRVIGR